MQHGSNAGTRTFSWAPLVSAHQKGIYSSMNNRHGRQEDSLLFFAFQGTEQVCKGNCQGKLRDSGRISKQENKGSQ